MMLIRLRRNFSDYFQTSETIWYKLDIRKKDNTDKHMAQKNIKDIYMKLLFHFISAPKPETKDGCLQRQRSCENMELSTETRKTNFYLKNTNNPLKTVNCGVIEHRSPDTTLSKSNKDTLQTFQSEHSEYLAPIKTCDDVTSTFGNVNKPSINTLDLLKCEKYSNRIDNSIEKESIRNENHLLSPGSDTDSIDEWKAVFVSEYLPISSRVQNWVCSQRSCVSEKLFEQQDALKEDDLQEEDCPQFVPTLACIEEEDEDEDESGENVCFKHSNKEEILSLTNSLGCSMEKLSSHSMEGNLMRSQTFEDLSTLTNVEDNCWKSSFEGEQGTKQDSFVESDSNLSKNADAKQDAKTAISKNVTSMHENVTQNQTGLTFLDGGISQTYHWQSENYMNSLNSRSTHSTYTVDSAYSSHERLNTLYSSIPDISDESYEDDYLEYIPVSYADTRAKRKKRWVARSASEIYYPSQTAGESTRDKLNTIKRQLTRTLSRKGKMSKSEEKLKDSTKEISTLPLETPLPQSKNEDMKKLSRTPSLRKALSRFFRRVRRLDFTPSRKTLPERSRSLPTNLNEV